MYEKILKGYVYKYDTIRILNEDQDLGIIFEVIEEECNDTLSYEYLDYIYNKYNLLPFLTDILPYHKEEVDISLNKKNGLVGIIKYKTRINHKHNKYYLFYILKIGDDLVKGMIWKENFKYSSLEINDEVLITKYRQSKGYPNQGHVENNEFSELSYFDIKEITISELYLISRDVNGNKISNSINKDDNSINNKNSINKNKNCINENSYSINKDNNKNNKCINKDEIFYDISGIIRYRSVLNRRNHYGYSEYYLLNVEDKKIILFYNSDLDFYKIEAGNKLIIYNLKKINRNGFIFYISTIFTQFKYENINEMDERCSTFLYENDIKRVKKEEDLVNNVSRIILDDKYNNDNRIILDDKCNNVSKIILDDNNSSNIKDNNNSSNIKDNSELFEDLNINNDDIRHILDDSSVMINLEIITPFKRKLEDDENLNDDINNENINDSKIITSSKRKLEDDENLNDSYSNDKLLNINNENKYIESGYGFLPDLLDTYQDKEEIINNKKYLISYFFPPKKISLEELEISCNKLVINESDKFIVEGKIKSIEKNNEDFSIRYIDTGDIKEQYPIIINIENNISFYIFGNFFTGEIKYEDLIKKIPCDVKECYDQEFIFILHVFRASSENIIYSVSEMYKK